VRPGSGHLPVAQPNRYSTASAIHGTLYFRATRENLSPQPFLISRHLLIRLFQQTPLETPKVSWDVVSLGSRFDGLQARCEAAQRLRWRPQTILCLLKQPDKQESASLGGAAVGSGYFER